MNIRMAASVSGEFQRIQDTYLQEENRARGIVELSALTPKLGSKIEVIFNVFKEIDEQIYRKLLG